MRHLKKQNIICFAPIELKQLYKNDKLEKLQKVLIEKGLNWSDLNDNLLIKNEIADIVVKKDLKRKEQIEIISALNSCIVFYGEDSEIGFPLKGSYDIKKNPIKSLKNLIDATKEDSLTDFAIIANSRMYQFQFKQYRNILETNEFFNFLIKVLKKYGNKLGKVNLLIMLSGTESVGMQKLNISFKKIREELHALSKDFGGSILVRFNGRNKFNFLVEVYPGKAVVKDPIDPDYLAGKLLYN